MPSTHEIGLSHHSRPTCPCTTAPWSDSRLSLVRAVEPRASASGPEPRASASGPHAPSKPPPLQHFYLIPATSRRQAGGRWMMRKRSEWLERLVPLLTRGARVRLLTRAVPTRGSNAVPTQPQAALACGTWSQIFSPIYRASNPRGPSRLPPSEYTSPLPRRTRMADTRRGSIHTCLALGPAGPTRPNRDPQMRRRPPGDPGRPSHTSQSTLAGAALWPILRVPEPRGQARAQVRRPTAPMGKLLARFPGFPRL